MFDIVTDNDLPIAKSKSLQCHFGQYSLPCHTQTPVRNTCMHYIVFEPEFILMSRNDMKYRFICKSAFKFYFIEKYL